MAVSITSTSGQWFNTSRGFGLPMIIARSARFCGSATAREFEPSWIRRKMVALINSDQVGKDGDGRVQSLQASGPV